MCDTRINQCFMLEELEEKENEWRGICESCEKRVQDCLCTYWDDFEPTENDVFTFLVELRDSGVTNMRGAAPYLEEEFGFDEKTAGKWLVKWIESFKQGEE